VLVSVSLMATRLGGFEKHPQLRWIAVLSLAGSVVGVLLLTSPRLRRLLGAEGWVQRLFERVGLERHWHAVLAYGDHQQLLVINVGLSFIEQLAPVVAFFICCLAFSVPVGFLQCLIIVPAATVLERLPISFGGIGMREAGIVYMGSLFGLPYNSALFVSVANELFYMVALVPAAFLIWKDSASD
jgi:uncharacterized membrane protein YbhN (UPF0104 family)